MYERPKSTRDNFGKFIHQFQPETKTFIRKLDKILIKLYRQNVSLLLNQKCLNERLLPNYTLYIYIYVCVYVCNSKRSHHFCNRHMPDDGPRSGRKY